jgi:hypothetical protein
MSEVGWEIAEDVLQIRVGVDSGDLPLDDVELS